MHTQTYMRLLDEHARRSEVALGYFAQSLDRLTGRLKTGMGVTLEQVPRSC